ncbi:MAG: branched-chain amino acid ABC transporter permease [Alphaproteobacteria bacterium]|nr:branched-chain amino acid ABC transporter permease [Alphaproteobacteria bacterium]
MTLLRSVPAASALAFAALVLAGFVLPDWAMFLVTMAFAKGLVALGIVGLMRGGLVSFGQGLYFCIGAYVSGLMANWTGITDIFLLSLLGVLAAGAIGTIFGPLLANYRGIFFAMLSLSLSMILYGALSKMTTLGGTDGLNVAAPTFLGYAPEGRPLGLALYLYTSAIVVLVGGLMRGLFNSQRGLIALAIRDNELRIEYLGASVRTAMAINYVIAAVLGGLGGVISGLAIGHVDPEFSFWTTSGEFVFVAILSGYLSIPAVFVGSILLEVVRSFSNLYFPNTWQLALGIFLLLVIVLLPRGLGSLTLRRRKAKEQA